MVHPWFLKIVEKNIEDVFVVEESTSLNSSLHEVDIDLMYLINELGLLKLVSIHALVCSSNVEDDASFGPLMGKRGHSH